MQKQNASRLVAIVFMVCLLHTESGLTEVEQEPLEGSGFFYIIQRGDTLWDLSQRFYNDQWTWPGLWEMNQAIKNPHWIFPGKKIRIFLTQTLDSPPKPPPAMADNRPRGKKPPGPAPFFAYPSMDSLGFIREKPIDELGKIIGSQNNSLMMAQGETIYITPTKEHSLVPGKEYRIISTQEVSTNFNREKFNGVKHIILGIIKVVEVEDNYATALITRSFDHASAGDLIAPFEPSSGKIPVKKSLDTPGAHILCSLANDSLLSEHKIAFINRGSYHGIKPGQTYTLFEQREGINSPYLMIGNTPGAIKIKDRAMGTIIVLHTEATASTILVLSCSNEFSPGVAVDSR